MRILVRTSKLASWARRFASFALPLAVMPVFLHRSGVLDSATFLLVETIAFSCALLGVTLGILAYVRLWFTGDRGWGRATTGIMLGLGCLSPVFVAGVMAQMYPATTDISTAPGIEIGLTTANRAGMSEQITTDMSLVFPGIGPRDYQLGANAVYRVVENMMTARGWTITERVPPQLEDTSSQLNAIVTTLLGWRDEFAVRIEGNATQSHVVIRSASVAAGHDLGANGRRVADFLVELDAAVTEAMLTAPVMDGPPIPQVQNTENN